MNISAQQGQDLVFQICYSVLKTLIIYAIKYYVSFDLFWIGLIDCEESS